MSRLKRYAVSVSPTVMYNAANIFAPYDVSDGVLESRDEDGLVTQVQAQAVPGTGWEIVGEETVSGMRVYNAKNLEFWQAPDTQYFIDARAVELTDDKPPLRDVLIPGADDLQRKLLEVHNLNSQDKIHYVWGGNTLEGIPAHKEWYGSGVDLDSLSDRDKKQFLIQGLDCSGLLYHITNGAAPRACYWLKNFGDSVPIQGKSAKSITETLRPLDMILFQGHVALVMDKDSTIEMRNPVNPRGDKDLAISAIADQVNDLLENKEPVDEPPSEKKYGWFSVRRFAKNKGYAPEGLSI